VRNHAFINYDDTDYVLDNAHVTAGLSWQTISWALTATEAANWHPITWLSHALDCQLFGLDAGFHHLTSVLIHTLNVLLLFLLLWKATGAVGRSFLVAALFAWHPLNVQTVAWVAERKSLLSGLFFLLTIGAYGWYAQLPGVRRYLVLAAIFALALASKPMAVTLPLVLLLLDYWPLQRVQGWTNASAQFPTPQRPIRRLLLEKVPLFALAATSSIVTLYAQRAGGALRTLQTFSLKVRLENASLSYLLYIEKMLWPSSLSVFYPHPGNSLSIWKAIFVAVLLVAISVAVWLTRKRYPYLTVGWLWFVCTLVPVIGVIQVGDQQLADRYAYIPLIGLFIATVWGVCDFCDLHHLRPALRWAVPGALFALLSLLTWKEISYWQDAFSLWSRSLQVTNGNLQVEKQLANAMVREGETDAVMPHLLNIAQRDPNDLPTIVNLGSYFADKGQIEDAIAEFDKAVNLTAKNPTLVNQPYRSSALLNLGFAYAVSRDYPGALKSFREADRVNPAMVVQTIHTLGDSLANAPSDSGYIKLCLLLQAEGEESQASSILQDAVSAHPENLDTQNLLGYLTSESRLSPKIH
jgi:tetratricopeptide (TPR) repeat protein